MPKVDFTIRKKHYYVLSENKLIAEFTNQTDLKTYLKNKFPLAREEERIIWFIHIESGKNVMLRSMNGNIAETYLIGCENIE